MMHGPIYIRFTFHIISLRPYNGNLSNVFEIQSTLSGNMWFKNRSRPVHASPQRVISRKVDFYTT